MTTEQTTDTLATETATTGSAPKLAKTSTITLTANGSSMSIVAERRAEGARTYVITTDANKKSERGMTSQHPTFDAAKSAIEKMADKAEKLGWRRPAARRGFVARPDSFAVLPAPAPAPTPKGKK